MEDILEFTGHHNNATSEAMEESKAVKNMKSSHRVKNEIQSNIMLSYSKRVKDKDKKDYSTVEKVIDPKTEILLEKWITQGLFSRVGGCISAGKEANVYYAEEGSAEDMPGDKAVKVYKVETMVFRDREDYIEGEWRYRRGHCRTNPRKLIKLWAEKEFRNLKRMRAEDLRVPEPLRVHNNVMVMQFLGVEGRAAPSKSKNVS